MKKLLILLSLLLATNVWAEAKTLICKWEGNDEKSLGIIYKINYDLELTNADIIISNNEDFLPYSQDNEGYLVQEILTVLSVSPTKLTFTISGIGSLDFRIEVDRHDLVLREMEKIDNFWEGGPPGKCQIVRAKKTRI